MLNRYIAVTHLRPFKDCHLSDRRFASIVPSLAVWLELGLRNIETSLILTPKNCSVKLVRVGGPLTSIIKENRYLPPFSLNVYARLKSSRT